MAIAHPPGPAEREPTQHAGYRYVGERDGCLLAVAVDTGRPVYVRLVARHRADVAALQRDIGVRRRLVHPHIAQLLEVYITPTHLGVVTERLLGGSLHELVVRGGPLAEGDARWYMQQLAVAMQFCHMKDICGLDLSAHSTQLATPASPLLKLVNLHHVSVGPRRAPNGSLLASPDYVPPEQLQAGAAAPDKAGDVWACGVLLCVLLAGKLPFGRAEDSRLSPPQRFAAVAQRILEGDAVPLSTSLSAPVRDLASRMLAADPAARPSLDEILAHPWIQVKMPEGAAGMNERLLQAEAPALRNPQG